jgi:hypothetical protein
MNWYSIFYWVTRADSVKDFFDIASNLFTTFAVITFLVLIIISAFAKMIIVDNNLTSEEDEDKNANYRGYKRLRGYFATIFYTTLALSLITWTGYVFTPTKKETLLIIAGGGTMQFLTTDSAAKQIPHELSTFVVTELKSMAKEAQVDLGIATQKDKILEEASRMSSLELIERVKVDTNFAKIIMDR